MNIFKWFKERGEVWHYTCQNNHTWKSRESPGGGYFAPKTRCPICKTEVCKGEIYINGKITAMGAVHCDYKFPKKPKRRKK